MIIFGALKGLHSMPTYIILSPLFIYYICPKKCTCFYMHMMMSTSSVVCARQASDFQSVQYMWMKDCGSRSSSFIRSQLYLNLHCFQTRVFHFDEVTGAEHLLGKIHCILWERSGSVVECFTRDQGAVGLSLTGVAALWSLSKAHLS